MRFGSQDYWLTQSHHTLTYTRQLQYWAEKTQPLSPSQPCCLAESVVEFWWAMELLVLFTEVGLFAAVVPSNWAEVSLPRLMEPTPWDPNHNCSHSQSCWACQRGPCWQPMAKTSPLPPRRQMQLLLHPRRPCCCSLTTRPHALWLGLQKLHDPCGERNQWRMVQQRSLASCPKKPWIHTR